MTLKIQKKIPTWVALPPSGRNSLLSRVIICRDHLQEFNSPIKELSLSPACWGHLALNVAIWSKPGVQSEGVWSRWRLWMD